MKQKEHHPFFFIPLALVIEKSKILGQVIPFYSFFLRKEEIEYIF